MADKEVQEPIGGNLTGKIDVDVEDALRGLKEASLEARKAAQAFRELGEAAAKVTEIMKRVNR